MPRGADDITVRRRLSVVDTGQAIE